jgi:PBSX family phage terminase large subunit
MLDDEEYNELENAPRLEDDPDWVPRARKSGGRKSKASKHLSFTKDRLKNKRNKDAQKVRVRSKQLQKITEENAEDKKELLKEIIKIADNRTGMIPAHVKEEIEQYYPEVLEDKKIGWSPFPGPQTQFLEADEFEVLFSGGRAPGKSDALMMDALRYCGNRSFRGLVIRKAMNDLRDLIRRAKELYPQAYPGTKWKEQEKLFVFPSGATMEFGYCDHEDDVARYQGQEYTWLGIDELTQIPNEETYEKLVASVRKRGDGLKNYIRCTTNPNGPGKVWVKKRFVDRGTANSTITLATEIPGIGTIKTTRKWIHGTVFDNPKYVNENPQYIAMLQNIDNAVLRKQWLEGDWDSADGLAFDEFSRKTHVIKPFEVPSSWYRFRACDWGYKTKAVCLWMAVDFDGRIYVYREFTSGPGTPNGMMLAKEFGHRIREIEEAANERVRYGILDVSAWSQRGEDAPSPAEDMGNLTWRPSDRTKHSRVTGKQQVHRYLQKDEDGKPGVLIFDTCLDLISCMSSLAISSKDNEDAETKGDDHAYDALRYGLMSRPRVYNNYDFQAQQSLPPEITNLQFGY